MRAGELQHRVTIQQPARAGSGTGRAVNWQPVARVWAKIQPVRSTDRTAEGHFQTIRLYRVTIRYQKGLDTKMRVVYGDRTFQISSLVDVDEHHRQLDLLCEESGG